MKKIIHQSTCDATMKLLGDYWTLRIIDSLNNAPLRFCELQRQLDNLNPVTLTNRLKRLEDAQLISRQEDTVDKISVVYALTQLGKMTLPVIEALDNFSTKLKVTI